MSEEYEIDDLESSKKSGTAKKAVILVLALGVMSYAGYSFFFPYGFNPNSGMDNPISSNTQPASTASVSQSKAAPIRKRISSDLIEEYKVPPEKTTIDEYKATASDVSIIGTIDSNNRLILSKISSFKLAKLNADIAEENARKREANARASGESSQGGMFVSSNSPQAVNPAMYDGAKASLASDVQGDILGLTPFDGIALSYLDVSDKSAILRVDGRDAFVKAGDSVNGIVIEEITKDTIVLANGSEKRTLRASGNFSVPKVIVFEDVIDVDALAVE
jgi:hypothetical protein